MASESKMTTDDGESKTTGKDTFESSDSTATSEPEDSTITFIHRSQVAEVESESKTRTDVDPVHTGTKLAGESTGTSTRSQCTWDQFIRDGPQYGDEREVPRSEQKTLLAWDLPIAEEQQQREEEVQGKDSSDDSNGSRVSVWDMPKGFERRRAVRRMVRILKAGVKRRGGGEG